MKLHWFRRKVSKEVNMYEREVWTLSMYGMESIEFVDSFKRKCNPVRRRVRLEIINLEVVHTLIPLCCNTRKYTLRAYFMLLQSGK